jgi:hypothetical protein
LRNRINEWSHWATWAIARFTKLLTSQRIESFFGHLKDLLDHQITSLVDLVAALRITAEIAFNTSMTTRPVSVPPLIMAIDEQSLVGAYVLNYLTEFIELMSPGAYRREHLVPPE